MDSKEESQDYTNQPSFSAGTSNPIQAELTSTFGTTTPVYGNPSPFESNSISFQRNWNNVNSSNGPYVYAQQLVNGPILPPIITTPIHCSSSISIIGSCIPISVLHPVLPNIYSPVISTNIAFQENSSHLTPSNISWDNTYPSVNTAVLTGKVDPFPTQISAISNVLRTENIKSNSMNTSEKQCLKVHHSLQMMTDNEELQATISKEKLSVYENRLHPVITTNADFQNGCKDVNSPEILHVNNNQMSEENVDTRKLNSFSSKMSIIDSSSRIENCQDATINMGECNQRFNMENIFPAMNTKKFEVESGKFPNNRISSIEPTNNSFQNDLNKRRTSSNVPYDDNDKFANKSLLPDKSDSFVNQASTVTNGTRPKNIQVITVKRKDGSRRYIVQQLSQTSGDSEFQNESTRTSITKPVVNENKMNPVESNNIISQTISNVVKSSNDSCYNNDQSLNKTILIDKTESFLNQQSRALHDGETKNLRVIAVNKKNGSQRCTLKETSTVADNNELEAEPSTAPMAGIVVCGNRNQTIESANIPIHNQCNGTNSLNLSYDNSDQLINRTVQNEETNVGTTQIANIGSNVSAVEDSQIPDITVYEGNRHLSVQRSVATTDSISPSNLISSSFPKRAISLINAEISGERRFNLNRKSSGYIRNINCSSRGVALNSGNNAALAAASTSEKSRRSSVQRNIPKTDNIQAVPANSISNSSVTKTNPLINAEISVEQSIILNRKKHKAMNAPNNIISSSMRQIVSVTENEYAPNVETISEGRPRSSIHRNISPSGSVSSLNSDLNSSCTTSPLLANAEISGEREMNLLRKMRDGMQNIICSMRQIVSATGIDGISAVQTTNISSPTPSSSVDISPANQERSFNEIEISSNASFTNNSDTSTTCNSVKTKSVKSLNDPKEISKAELLNCAVCLEDYNGVISKGAHFVAFTCGHIFCNMCVIQLKFLKKCPRCRSRIIFAKIVRLYF